MPAQDNAASSGEPSRHELDQQAIAELWQRFGARLRQVARNYLGAARPVVDSEDIASQAFASLIRKLRQGDEKRNGATAAESTALQGDDWVNDEFEYGIWPVALGIARNKARESNRQAVARKRGGNQDRERTPAEQVVDPQQDSPLEIVCVAEQFKLLARYVADRPELAEIVRLRLDGRSSKVIAAQLRLSEASVCRRLKEVRKVLEESGVAGE